MSLAEQIIVVVMVILGTMRTRFLPFLIFPAGKPTPQYIRYLGKALPAAVFGLFLETVGMETRPDIRFGSIEIY